MRRLLVITVVALLAGCGAMPKHHETRSTDAAMIILEGFPAGAAVYVDGTASGVMAEEDATTVAVSAGSHDVEVRSGGSVVFKRTVFVDRGTERHLSP